MGSQKQRTGGVTFTIDAKRIRENSDGSITVGGHLTTTGVAEYQRGDSKVRELRSDEEVFREDSLETLRGVGVTIGHPAGMFLTLDNLQQLQVGVVSHVEAKPPHVDGTIRIWDAEAAHMVKTGRLKETSCGYGCTPVEATTDEADYVQTNIHYNHVALIPEGASRWGTTLRLDSNDNEVLEHFKKGPSMDEIQKALEPVLEAIKQTETRYDELSKRLDEAIKAKDTEEKSPVTKYEELPSEQKVDSLVNERVQAILKLELEARDAYEEIFGWRKDSRGQWHRSDTYHVEPTLCGHKLCEEVLQTVDENVRIDGKADLAPFVREAQLLAKRARQDRLSERPTIDGIRQRLSGVPAHVLQTPKSGIRAHIFGNQEG